MIASRKRNSTRTELRSLVLQALKSFIGQSKSDVIKYWGEVVPGELIKEGYYSDTKEKFVVVMSGNVGRPEFEATFRNNVCSSQTVNVSAEDLSECIDVIRRQGFSYSSRLKRWSKPGESYVWRIEEHYGDNFSLITRRMKNVNRCYNRISSQLSHN
jgi:hypothetical protein